MPQARAKLFTCSLPMCSLFSLKFHTTYNFFKHLFFFFFFNVQNMGEM